MADGLPATPVSPAIEQILADYLQAHPDFFVRHPELLENLRIPHSCGPAVSLLERQIQWLRERNAQIHRRLDDLVEVAHQNGELVTRLQRLNLVLIGSRSLEETLQGIRSVLREVFMADFTALRLPPMPPVRREDGQVLTPALQSLFEPLLHSGQPWCGRLTRVQAEALFGTQAPQVASVALVPLQGEDWSGLLAVGSQDETRFFPGMGILFLSCMGELISHALQWHLGASSTLRLHSPSPQAC